MEVESNVIGSSRPNDNAELPSPLSDMPKMDASLFASPYTEVFPGDDGSPDRKSCDVPMNT